MAISGNAPGEPLALPRIYRKQRRLSLSVAFLIAAAGSLSGCGAATSSAHRTESVHMAIRTSAGVFSVNVEAGSLRLIPGRSGLLSLRGTVTYRGGLPPSISWQGSGGNVLLRSMCHSRDGECGYNYVISVPAATTVVADVIAGNVRATGLEGTLRLTAAAGNVTLDGVSGALHVTGGSGNITAAGLRSASSDVKEGAGNVTLGFTAAPSHLVVKAGAGNVSVVVPRSFNYHVLTSDQLGNVSSGITDDPSSARVISLSVGTGNISLDDVEG